MYDYSLQDCDDDRQLTHVGLVRLYIRLNTKPVISETRLLGNPLYLYSMTETEQNEIQEAVLSLTTRQTLPSGE